MPPFLILLLDTFLCLGGALVLCTGVWVYARWKR